MSSARVEAQRRERRSKAIEDGWAEVRSNTVLDHLARGASLSKESLTGVGRWAVVSDRGLITPNRARDAEPGSGPGCSRTCCCTSASATSTTTG